MRNYQNARQKVRNDVREKFSLQKVSYIRDLELYHVIL